MTKDQELYTNENGVLRNLLGINNQEELNNAERLITSKEISELQKCKFGDMSEKILVDIHKRLFGKIYPWAGQFRQVELSKGNTDFCPKDMIRQGLSMTFMSIGYYDNFKMLPKEEFCHKCADVFNRLNDLHPFREGNGRTIRTVIYHIAKNAGWLLDLSKCNREEYMAASIAGCNGYHKAMEHLMLKTIKEFPDRRVSRAIRLEREKLLNQEQAVRPSSRRRESVSLV